MRQIVWPVFPYNLVLSGVKIGILFLSPYQYTTD